MRRDPGFAWAALFTLVCGFTLACKRKSAPQLGALYTPAEIKEMVDGLVRRLEHNRSLECTRAVLHGPAVPGPADDDIHALVEPTGELLACRELIAKDLDALTATLALPVGLAPLPELAGVEKVCAGVEAAFKRAAAHENACSPYVIGRRERPESMTALLLVTKAAVLRARELTREGRAADGLRLLLDVARVNADVGRGPTDLVTAMIGLAGSRIAARAASAIAASDVAIADADLAAMIGDVDQLLATAPHPQDWLIGERDETALAYSPSMTPADFTPPGGWLRRNQPLKPGEFAPLSDADMGAIMVQAFARSLQPMIDGCPRTASLIDCTATVAKLDQQASQAEDDSAPPDPLTVDTKSVERVLSSAKSVEHARQQLIDVLAGAASRSFSKSVPKQALGSHPLAGLRAQLAVRRRLLAGGACPTVTDFAQPPLAALLDVPGLGAAMRVAAAEGGVKLELPEALARWFDDILDVVIVCPLKSPSKAK